MKISVLYFAHLRRHTGECAREEYELQPGQTATDLLAIVIDRHPGIRPHLPSLLVTRNEEWTARDTMLQDGDIIGLMPPVSGG